MDLNKGISTPLAIVIILVCAALVGGVAVWQLKEKPKPPKIKTPEEEEPALILSNYPRLFEKDVLIVIGEDASQIEFEGAKIIAAKLEELTEKKQKIKSGAEVLESDKKTRNLILIGASDSNTLLQKVYKLTNATGKTKEYPEENRGILEIMRNPWNPERTLLIVAGSNKWGVKGASIRLTEKSITITEKENIKRLSKKKVLTDKFITLKGKIRMVGHEPFTSLVITTEDGTNYEVIGNKKETSDLQNEFLEVQGFFRSGRAVHVESGGTIEVMEF